MKRPEIYETIVDSFENKYSFLGKQFAEEFLLSVASSNIQKNSKPEFRVRRHLALFWPPAWFNWIKHQHPFSTIKSLKEFSHNIEFQNLVIE